MKTEPSTCSKQLLIIGDRFKNFASGKDAVCTIAEFKSLAFQGLIDIETSIVIGQGVEHDSFYGVVAQLLRRHRYTILVENLEQIADQVDFAHQSSVHKAKLENVLISRPVKCGDTEYTAWLSIQDGNELLNDHMTGQHIQGMVLTEAARQMLLTVSENFLLEAEQRGKCYFVLNSLNTAFSRFAFPVPTLVVFKTLSEDRRPGKSLRVTCGIEFYQNHNDKELIATVNGDFTAFSAEFIAGKEAGLAASIIGSGGIIPALSSSIEHTAA